MQEIIFQLIYGKCKNYLHLNQFLSESSLKINIKTVPKMFISGIYDIFIIIEVTIINHSSQKKSEKIISKKIPSLHFN